MNVLKILCIVRNQKILFLIALLLFTLKADACKCPPLAPINNELIKKYDLIFYGRIDSLSSCSAKGMATAYFSIDTLYKGIAQKQIAIYFDCQSSCMMGFAKNEQWIIYASYLRYGEASVSFCSHSRKYFKNMEDDFYQAVAHRSFDEEILFLKTTLGVQAFLQDENTYEEQQLLIRHNTLPSDKDKLILLLSSFVVMTILFVIIKVKKNKNDK